jgi:UDPglucose 6-dehydrogenase
MKILIVGTGYVGLVTGACFAEMGHEVICLDINKLKIEELKKGIIPFYEPGLEEIVNRNINNKRLFFTTDYEKAVKQSSVCFLAVPTPSNEDGSCNTSYIENAAKQIAEHINEYKIIVNKSTVPVGTAKKIKKTIQEILSKKKTIYDFDVISNPEFLKEGTAVSDCMKPDRIVIGSDSEKALKIMRQIYSSFMLSRDKVIEMDILSSEMTKYTANAMLATRISFMNEIAEICKKVGANINEVRKGVGSDNRIGYSFLYAGIGYGGSCFPKDIRALYNTAVSVDLDPLLLKAVDTINNKQKKILSHKINNYFSKRGGIKGKTIAIWGLSFKPDTDDMREAPSLILIEHLQEIGANLRLYDPVSTQNAKKLIKNHSGITWCEDEFEAVEGADGLALITEWKQFRLINFDPVMKKMNGKVIFDGRNQYKPVDMHEKGFDYICIGVPDLIRPHE